MIYLNQAAKQEVQAAETVSKHRQEGPTRAPCRSEDLEGAAGQLVLTGEANHVKRGRVGRGGCKKNKRGKCFKSTAADASS